MHRTGYFLLIVAAAATAGDNGFSFLKLRMHPHSAATGGTLSFTDWRGFSRAPSVVNAAEHREVFLSYTHELLDVSSTDAALVWPTTQGVWGGSLTYVSYGTFDGYDESGNQTITFAASDFSASAFYGRTVREKWKLGGAIKFIHSSIASYGSSALAIDGGVLAEWERFGIQLGGGVSNLGFAIDPFDRKRESLPLGLHLDGQKAWGAVSLQARWYDFHRSGSLADRLIRGAIGMEYRPIESLVLRGGYDHGQRETLSLPSGGAAGLAGGIGFRYGKYTFDYSWNTWRIGAIHRMAVSVRL